LFRRAGCTSQPAHFDPMIRRTFFAVLLLAALPLFALDDTSLTLLNHAWPNVRVAKISEIGQGIGVVFSPDLSVPDNCNFYKSLGFACFQDANWSHVLDQIHEHNTLFPEHRISTLVLETHGTNGNGLKLQESYDPEALRSYISVGALQERLEPEGIYYVIISACNSGRLLRPAIYKALDPNNGDKLFLPATCGIINASDPFDPTQSPVMIITPQSSHIEATVVGEMKELPAATRRAILAAARQQWTKPPVEFAVSDMMAQMITRDPKLELAANTYVDRLSRQMTSEDRSELLFKKFLTYLNAVTARQTVHAPKVAKTTKKHKKAPSSPAAATAAASPR